MNSNPRHRHAQRLALMLLAAVCLMTLLPGPYLYANAEDAVTEEPAPTASGAPVDLTQKCSLTVYRVPQNSEYEEDAAAAETMVVDVYQIAEAVAVDNLDTFDLKLVAPFNTEAVRTAAGIAADADTLSTGAAVTEDTWTAIAQAAAVLIRDAATPVTPTVSGGSTGAGSPAPTAIADLQPGLYLLIMRTDAADYWQEIEDETTGDKTVATLAYSDRYNYLYAPQLVVLPYRSNTAAAEDWQYDLSVYLKPEVEPREGDLVISKTLTGYRGQGEAKFIFQVEATLTKNGQTSNVYSNVVSITFEGDDTKLITLARAIPIGANVTITEIYAGPNSKLTSAKTVTGVMTVDGLLQTGEEEAGPAEFTNQGGYRDGGGITNRYVWNDDGTGGGSWSDPVHDDGTVPGTPAP